MNLFVRSTIDNLSSSNSTVEILQGMADQSVSLYAGMTPNFRFNVTEIVIWSILLCVQIGQLIYKQYWFSVAFICTGILEVLGYIGRTWSHKDVTLMDPFLLNMICLTIAPVFTMGGMYYQLAKLIEIYGHKYSKIITSPILFSYIFITSDIVSLAIQAAGGGTAGMAVSDNESPHTGDNIFVAGLAVQVASMLIFLILWFYFLYCIYVPTRLQHLNIQGKWFSRQIFKVSQRDIDYMYNPQYRAMRMEPDRWNFRYFTLAMTVAVLTIFTRCCYRLAELSEGWSGNLITHEWYFIALDSLMMTIATVAMTIFHPGYAFLGRTNSIPITKLAKREKKNNYSNHNNDIIGTDSSDTDQPTDEKDFDLEEQRVTGIPFIGDDHDKGKKFNLKFWK